MELGFAPLTAREEAIGHEVVDAAFAVHLELGPGLLENVYAQCFCYELTSRGLSLQSEVPVPITYGAPQIAHGLRLDVVVDNLVICELKACEESHPVWEAQLLTYLKLSRKRLGFLINFNVPKIKDGIRRIIL